MAPLPSLIADIVDERPFALIARDGTHVEVLVGDVVDVGLLADIPLIDTTGTPREVLALVPYRQVGERGFTCHDDNAPLRCLVVDHHTAVPLDEAIAGLPSTPIPLRDAGFEVSDEEYAEVVRRVIADEIGRGEGANFVIRRDFTAAVDADPLTSALTWFRALLEHERGAYWTFLVSTPGHLVVGASPEAHVTSTGGVVTMNPISGTFRHPASGPSKEDIAEFLASTKETEELFMVVDEELKMMAAVCSDGGRITGPRLKEMSRLTHTEYVLRGRSTMDPRDILRETMFAPTVTGSPMQNACTVIARHENSARGYYSGVAALFTPSTDAPGTHDLDAPILIRTAYLADGILRVPVGATLVRHSDPLGEVSETHGKAAGVLGAIGAVERTGATVPVGVGNSAGSARGHGDDPEISQLLRSRNARLAPFWMNPQEPDDAGPFAGRSVLVVDAEDRFTMMLAHQLRRLGCDVTTVPWSACIEGLADSHFSVMPDSAHHGQESEIHEQENETSGPNHRSLRCDELCEEPRRVVPKEGAQRPSRRALNGTSGRVCAHPRVSRPSRLASSWSLRCEERASKGTSGTGQQVYPRSLSHQEPDNGTLHVLSHQGREQGSSTVTSASAVELDAYDLVLAGPGPGDPRDLTDTRMARMREVVASRLEARKPLVAVCLSHQILADHLGLDLTPLDAPHQGVQKLVDIFGSPASIGFYNTFTARVRTGTTRVGAHGVEAEVAADPTSGDVYALRGDSFASVQGHLESILSPSGVDILTSLVRHALTTA